RVEGALSEIAGVTDVERSRKAGVPQAVVKIDRDKAAQLGLSARDVAETIETAVAGRRVGDYRPEGDSYRILVQLEAAQHLSLDEILDMTVEVPGTGETVALRNVVHIDDGRGPVLIDRKDQQRIISVTANVAGRDLGSVAADAQAQLAEIARPMGYDLDI